MFYSIFTFLSASWCLFWVVYDLEHKLWVSLSIQIVFFLLNALWFVNSLNKKASEW